MNLLDMAIESVVTTVGTIHVCKPLCERCRTNEAHAEYSVGAYPDDYTPVRAWLCIPCTEVITANRAFIGSVSNMRQAA